LDVSPRVGMRHLEGPKNPVFMLACGYTCVVRVRVYVLCVHVHVLVCFFLAVCVRACLRARVYACVRIS